MSNNSREELKNRIRRMIWQYAIFRPESAVVIALTLVLTAISLIVSNVNATGADFIIPWWGWLIGGGIGEAILLYSSLTDPKVSEKIVEAMFKEKFKPEQISDKELQKQIKEALDYRGRITELISQRTDTVLKDTLTETVVQIDEWIKEVYDLARRLDEYRSQKNLVEENTKRAHERIRQLQQQHKMTTDPAFKRDIEANITSLMRQVETNTTLQNTMDRARLRLENTITAMATIYSQTILMSAKDIDSGRAQRLRQDIADEVVELSDILVAMDEVYVAQEA